METQKDIIESLEMHRSQIKDRQETKNFTVQYSDQKALIKSTTPFYFLI